MDFKKLNITVGWLIWVIASLVYLTTIEPTASFWDCGEFIASAAKLEVGHPPGAPFFMILGRFFVNLSEMLTGGAEHAAMGVNILSALSSSFCILFLFWTITAFARKLATLNGKEITGDKVIAIIGSGVVGALAYTFSDSFWFSAVEGEVYAISSLFTAVVVWAIMKWDAEPDEIATDRWIIFIAYMMGLSIGVHLLNLLCIPAIALVIYFKNNEFNWKGLISTGVVSLVVLGFIQSGIIPGLVTLAGGYELFFTNSLGTGFNIGVLIFSILLIAVCVLLILFARNPDNTKRIATLICISLLTFPLWGSEFLSTVGKLAITAMAGGLVYMLFRTTKPSRILHMATMCFAVIVIGYSTFAMIVIRSHANPPMDENNPENVFTLLSYLNREQYGDRPLLSGHYWMAPAVDQEDGDPVYMKAYTVKKGDRAVEIYNNPFDAEQYIEKFPKKGYEIVEEYTISDERKDAKYVYDDRFSALFPRMYSNQPNHIREYKRWSNFKGKSVRVQGRGTLKVPTAMEDFRFFTSYQVNHMYWRYFMWNFAGRQNDQQGHGNILDGNWLTGLNAIDSQRLGDQSALPSSMESNKARNHFYLIPLILGLIGLIYQMIVDTKNWLVVLLLFLLTGLAIVIYLNQYPMQPRERDYAYVGSFYAFAIWLGLGVYAIFDAGRRLSKASIVKVAGVSLGLPIIFYLWESVGSSDHSFSMSLFYVSLVGLAFIGIAALIGNSNRKAGAGVAVLLGLVAPYLMASEGWDDHNRAKRRTGVDFAKNYLDSCSENAILFTNGDNDTFPLWYVQEVEGYRTDVRVCNLSLLNTDWYIDQQKRQAYESAPVPFSLHEQKYRQGTRDLVLLNPNQQEAVPMDLKKAMEFVADDSKTIPIPNSAQKFNYFPTNRFTLDLDREDLLRRGIVTPADTAMIPPRMEWAVGGQYLLKNNLMALDLIANNNWERDIYYAVTTGPDTYINLDPYFELTGMAYKLTPMFHPESEIPNPNKVGGVATDVMYKNVMEKFRWGNMDSEELYMDENNLRMTTNMRLQMSNLAGELIDESRNDMAKDILDKAFEVMPEENVPYDMVVLPMVEQYAEIGDLESAEKIGTRLFEIMEENQEYYTNLDPRFMRELSNEMQRTDIICKRIARMATIHKMEGAQDLARRVAILDQALKDAQQRMKESGRKSGKKRTF